MSSVLWCGGEDIDFPNGSAPTVTTTSTNFRSTYARAALRNAGVATANSRSLSFGGGAVTTCWLHAQVLMSTIAGTHYIGLGLNSAGAGAIFIGADSTTGSKLALYKLNSGTFSVLANETGTSLVNSTLAQFDMQITSFGGSATVNVYMNGTLLITFSGSTSVTGISNLDCVVIPGIGGGGVTEVSEIIVTDTLDTRNLTLQTFQPAGAGTTNNWDAGDFSKINPATINDANFASVNSTAKDLQATLPSVASGTWNVLATKVIARAEVTAGAVPTGIKLGYRISGSVYVDSAHTLTSAFASYERAIDNTNPATSAAWTQSDLGSLQLDLQSA